MKNVRMSICLIAAIVAMTVAHGLGSIYSENPVVEMNTNFGQIVIELYHDNAPVTVDNFIAYTNAHFYDNLIFHRVINNFVIQGGGYCIENNYMYKPPTGPPIINESYNNLSNLRGTIAMARTSNPDSATSEFYINLVNNTFLDRNNAADGFGYCVFGNVISGMNVVDTIGLTPVVNIGYGFENFPYPTLVIINDVKLIPEPATLLLLGLGAVILRRKK
jgi:peptidyl-prolyl cis-trans isomerase B (cyclophilin B)